MIAEAIRNTGHQTITHILNGKRKECENGIIYLYLYIYISIYWDIVNLFKTLIPVVYFIFRQNKHGLPITFKYFLISLCYVKFQNILVNVLVHLLEHLSF